MTARMTPIIRQHENQRIYFPRRHEDAPGSLGAQGVAPGATFADDVVSDLDAPPALLAALL